MQRPNPQPLSGVYPNCRNYIFHPGIIAEHPEAATSVAATIAYMSAVEGHVLDLLALFTKEDPVTIVNIVRKGSATNKRSMVATAAAALPTRLAQLFTKVEQAIHPARRHRDAFAHHIWGHSSEVPGFLLAPPQIITAGFTFTQRLMRMTEIERRRAMTDLFQDGIDRKPFEIDPTKIMVYSIGDLLLAEAEAKECLLAIQALMPCLDRTRVNELDKFESLLLARPLFN